MCGREGGREGAKLIHGVYSYTSLSAKKKQYSVSIIPHVYTLHWLSNDVKIKYKISSLCFSAITSIGPV